MSKTTNHQSCRLTEEECIELRKKYPDVKIEAHDCEWTIRDHEVVFKFEQHRKNCEKNGTIMVSYSMNDVNIYGEKLDMKQRLDNHFHNKNFHWFNGKEWITL